MTDNNIPVQRVLDAIIPTPRPAEDDTCDCRDCYDRRYREQQLADWRRLHRTQPC